MILNGKYKIIGNGNQVKDGDTVLVNMKKAHLAPGEMEKVVVPKKLLESVKGNELVVCLVPEEEK